MINSITHYFTAQRHRDRDHNAGVHRGHQQDRRLSRVQNEGADGPGGRHGEAPGGCVVNSVVMLHELLCFDCLL